MSNNFRSHLNFGFWCLSPYDSHSAVGHLSFSLCQFIDCCWEIITSFNFRFWFYCISCGFSSGVLFVLDISTNLLSIYQIFHSGSRKTVEFSPHDVVIPNLHDSDLIVAIGSVDSTSHLYRFDGFEPSDGTGTCLIAHVDLVRRLWHEHLGHVNYIYLQEMSTQALVIGLPQISCTNGVCQGCALGKQHRDPFPQG